MRKCFFFVCPTDSLEQVINETFEYENYFYTSLGNSFIYDNKTIVYLKQTIKKHNIREIFFVLSMDNKIVLDALGNRYFSDIKGLNNFYSEITKQKKRSEISSLKSHRQFTLLSYYLNKKIKELQFQLNFSTDQPIIGAKIYNRNQNAFTDIYSDLVCLEKYSLN